MHDNVVQNIKQMIVFRNFKKRKNFATLDINEMGFAIVQNIDERNNGKFLYCNTTACFLLELPEESVQDLDICAIMPRSIREHHPKFIQRFHLDGKARLLGVPRQVFIVCQSGAKNIKPVQIWVNFYFHSRFKYSFILQLDMVNTLNINPQWPPVKTREVMFFLTDPNLTIIEHSKNIEETLGLTESKMQEIAETTGNNLNMGDLLIEQEFLLELHANIADKHDVSISNKFTMMKSFMRTTNLPVILNFICNYYNNGTVQEYVFVVVPASKMGDVVDYVEDATGQLSRKQGETTRIILTDKDGGDGEDRTEQETQNTLESLSSMASRSTSQGTVFDPNSVKQSMFLQKTPRVLQINLYILVFLYIAYVTVTTFNLLIYLNKSDNIAN